MNKKRQVLLYVFSDFFTAAAAWALFFLYRKISIENQEGGINELLFQDPKFILGLILVPMFWVALYTLTGSYTKIFRKPRLRELTNTLSQSFFGALFLFFLVIIDDMVSSYKLYYWSLTTYFAIHFLLTVIARLWIISNVKKKLNRRVYGFKTILIGASKKAEELFLELNSDKNSMGYQFIGFVNINGETKNNIDRLLPKLGGINDLPQLIQEHQIEDVIIACDSSEHDSLNKIINKIDDSNVHIKVMPDMYDIITGSVKMNHLFGAPLIEVKTELMPLWQRIFKRCFDVFASILVMILFSPLYLFLAIGVKLSSKGPVFYSHERIGYKGKPFQIFKFRSMYMGAEDDGPQLARQNDKRITNFGKLMRKTRLDELPQFYNVLIGDMAIVGPRPERAHYIAQITKKAPHFVHLHKVRPGITSWGQVKYGYAENVDQMIERLKFDIIYIENMSLALDLKIMFYTVYIVLKGAGV